MPSTFRSFPGHVAVLGDTWMRMVDTRVTWTPTGKTWGSESKPFMVSDGGVFGIAKPGEAKSDGIARAAHEKIASDLAYHLGLPIPPVVLWRRSPCPAGAHPCCSISAIAYAQPLDLGSNMHLITGPLLDDARRITSAIAAFDSWIGAQDRCVHHLEMSPYLPFRNVTVGWGSGGGPGAEPQRSAAPDRRPIDRSSQPQPLTYRAGASTLGS